MDLNREKFFIAFLSLLLTAISIQAFGQHKPKLILQITVDQLRGDLPAKYKDRYTEGGLKYLLNNGIVFADAHYAHANTETAVGHAALATGAYPSVNGIISNDWFNEKTGEIIYSVEDGHSALLPFTGDHAISASDSLLEINPHQGRSPANIIGTTFGDELNFYTSGQSRIFGISVKDRGAITLAGHSGKAFWFDSKTGNFITSRYYYQEYPQWVKTWNLKKLADSYEGKSWELLNPKDTYLYGNRDDQSFEVTLSGYGRTFPHKYGNKDDRNFYRFLTDSPAGDEILLDFAESMISNEDLGKDDVTDYLSVSFSCTDYIDHIFGPSSLEAEDNLLRLDRVLSQLFKFIDQKVGLGNTLIVLSADHGASEAPELAKSYGIDAGRMVMSNFFNGINDELKQKFGAGKELVSSCIPPYIYLDHAMISDRKINQKDLTGFLINRLEKTEGIEKALSMQDFEKNSQAETPFTSLVRNNYYPGRSGDIYIVSKPYWLIFPDNISTLSVASSHGSPWDYDTFVPVIFAGFNLKPEKVYRKIYTVDIAPTLSAVIGCKYPSGNCGDVLEEVVKIQ
jgi:predicted AlkP superfamily pyrophosphatase or phosphodiesterase